MHVFFFIFLVHLEAMSHIEDITFPKNEEEEEKEADN